MYTPEMQSKLALWRQKSAEGTMTMEDYREAIAALRSGRLAASSKAASTKLASAKKLTADELLAQLEGL